MGEALRIESTVEKDTYVVRLYGELDLAEFEAVDGALAATTEPNLIVDLRGLTFIDSSGIRAVLLAHDRARERGGTITIIKGRPNVHRVFVLTGLDELLTFIEPD